MALAGLSSPGVRADEPKEVSVARAKTWQAVATGAFQDSIRHAVMGLNKKAASYACYKPEQIIDIAENLLAYQNGDGGWPKNIDWLKILPPEQLAGQPHGVVGKQGGASTFDNRNTWSQIGYLAQVHTQTHLQRYADSALKAIDYTLRAQRPSGGWCGADVDAVTFNDDVMSGVLRTFKEIEEAPQAYGFIDAPRRMAIKRAFDKGIRCILDSQIKVNGRLTAWCQQHDHATLQPIWARTFEPPSITAGESADVVRLLMSIDRPSQEVVRAIRAAVSWMDKVKIVGLRIDKVPAEPVKYRYHFADFDYVEVKDPAAPPIWARYYDLETEKPFFCNRDRKIVHRFSQIDRERRTGYAWYTHAPAGLLEKAYPAWQEKWCPAENVLGKTR